MNTMRVTDPVCGLTIPRFAAEARSEYNGQTYYFCYTACKTLFDWDPEKYVARLNQKENDHHEYATHHPPH